MLERMRRRNKVHPVSIVFHIGTSGTFPNPRICSLYLSVETRRMQPLNGRFPSGAAGFLLPAPRAEHISPLSGGELTGPRLIQDIVSTLLKAILSVNLGSIRDLPFPHARITYSSPLLIRVLLPNERIDSSYCPTIFTVPLSKTSTRK